MAVDIHGNMLENGHCDSLPQPKNFGTRRDLCFQTIAQKFRPPGECPRGNGFLGIDGIVFFGVSQSNKEVVGVAAEVGVDDE